MRKFLLIVFSLLLVLISVLVITVAIPNEPLPEGEVGTIFQLKDGRWMTNKGIILTEDDPRLPHLESSK